MVAKAPAETAEAELEARAARDTRRLHALIARVNAPKGDPAALGELRKLLDDIPGLWQRTGDVAFQAETSWLNTYAGPDEFAKETVSRKLRALRRELAGPAPAPLERLLAERIALCWLALHYAESLYAQRMGARDGLSFDTSTHMQDRIDRCQKRYLAAIKALAQIRRLQLPPVQVNVAGQQVNVAGGAGA